MRKYPLLKQLHMIQTTSPQAFFVDRPHKTNSNLLLVWAEWIICIYFLYVCFCVYRKYHRYRNIRTVDCKGGITTHWPLWLNPLNFMTTSSSAGWWFFFSILVFFHGHSRITGLQGKGGGHFFNFSLPLPPASQTLRHWPGDCCRELTSAHS